LVGNQADRTVDREVSTDQGERFRKDNNIQFFIETSAKTDLNVRETFIMAAKMLYRKHLGKIRKARENIHAKRRGDKLKRDNAAKRTTGGGCSC